MGQYKSLHLKIALKHVLMTRTSKNALIFGAYCSSILLLYAYVNGIGVSCMLLQIECGAQVLKLQS